MTIKSDKPLDLMRLVGLSRPKTESDRYGTLNRRMLAATIDSAIIMLLLAPPIDTLFNHLYAPISLDMNALNREMGIHPQNSLPLLAHALYASGYFTRWCANFAVQTAALMIATGLCWKRWSATPGKMLLRMRIVDAATEAPMSDRQIMLRLLGYLVSALPLGLGYIWIGIDKRRQGWHDKIANTLVIIVPGK